MKRIILLILFFYPGFNTINSQLISETKQPNSFSLSGSVIYIDNADYALVKKSAELLQQDIELVTGQRLSIIHDLNTVKGNIIIVGTIEKFSLIQKLIQQKKISTATIKNKWEAYQMQTVSKPDYRILSDS